MDGQLDDVEVDRLMSDVAQHGGVDAANFVCELPGSPWYIPPSVLGWRKQARDWGEREGLVESHVDTKMDLTFVVLTERGKAFKAALQERGIGIFVAPDSQPQD